MRGALGRPPTPSPGNSAGSQLPPPATAATQSPPASRRSDRRGGCFRRRDRNGRGKAQPARPRQRCSRNCRQPRHRRRRRPTPPPLVCRRRRAATPPRAIRVPSALRRLRRRHQDARARGAPGVAGPRAPWLWRPQAGLACYGAAALGHNEGAPTRLDGTPGFPGLGSPRAEGLRGRADGACPGRKVPEGEPKAHDCLQCASPDA